MKGNKFLITIGPSGVGKTTIVTALRDKQLLEVVPSWTTRPPRPGEDDNSAEHIFISEEEFDQKSSEGFFIDEVTMFGLPYRYGLPKISESLINSNDKIVTVMLRASLVPLFAKHYPDYVIYQFEDSHERIEQRLNDRMLHGEQLGSRLENYEQEVAAGREVASRVFVNTLTIDDIVTQVEHALDKDFGNS